MYVYVCMYVCMYVCIYVSMYLCIYVSMYLCIYVSMYLCIYVSMYVCMYVCVYIYCDYPELWTHKNEHVAWYVREFMGGFRGFWPLCFNWPSSSTVLNWPKELQESWPMMFQEGGMQLSLPVVQILSPWDAWRLEGSRGFFRLTDLYKWICLPRILYGMSYDIMLRIETDNLGDHA